MANKQFMTMLLLVIAAVGCRWGGKRDADLLKTAYQDNWQIQQQTVRSTPIPAPPKVEVAQTGLDTTASLPESIALHEAIEIALAKSNVARVTRGDTVTASANTFYDVEISEERMRATLAAFDTQFASEFYSNQFKNPPNSFFGPGLSQADLRDEAAITGGLKQPLIRGGSLSASYNPSPGYFFVPGSTSSGFNPRYISKMEFAFNQPLLRNAGRQVNVAPLQVAQLAVEQSAWDFKLSLIDSVRSVAESYWDLYAARVAVDEYEKVLPVLKEIIRIQEESLKAKLVIASDVAKARAQLYAYEQDYLGLQSEVVTQELRLKNLLKIPPSTIGAVVPATQPTTRRVTTTPNDSYLMALDCRPEVVQQRLTVSLRRLEVMVADNQRKPDFDFRALYRLNGLGEDLGDALDQMADAEFTDVELGFTLSMPVGLRQKKAEAQAARFRLARDRRLLEQEMFSVSHQIAEAVQKIDFAYREYEKAKLRLGSASEWVRGARLRYTNPAPDSSDTNWMLQYLDDYYRALRSRTDAAIEVASALNRYNAELVRYEQAKGTLLEFFAVDYCGDPCRQAGRLRKSTTLRRPVQVASMPFVEEAVPLIKEDPPLVEEAVPLVKDAVPNVDEERRIQTTNLPLTLPLDWATSLPQDSATALPQDWVTALPASLPTPTKLPPISTPLGKSLSRGSETSPAKENSYQDDSPRKLGAKQP